MDGIKDRIIKFLKLDSVIDNVVGYAESRLALMKIEVREEVANILSRGLMIMILFLIGFLVVLFLSLGLAQYLNTFFEEEYAGYILTAGFFGLLLLVLVLLRKNLFKAMEKQFENMIKESSNK
jgi:hypothetical protein